MKKDEDLVRLLQVHSFIVPLDKKSIIAVVAKVIHACKHICRCPHHSLTFHVRIMGERAMNTSGRAGSNTGHHNVASSSLTFFLIFLSRFHSEFFSHDSSRS